MKTVENRYNKTTCLVADATGQRYSADLYSYESTKALYDVYVIHISIDQKKKQYKTNMQLSEKDNHHEAIEKHFNI